MVIFILEPYLTDSHAYWLNGIEGLMEPYTIEKLTLPGNNWKWRMHSSAIEFSLWMKDKKEPDHILVSDMTNLNTLKSLLPATWTKVKLHLYFHENQITFPWSSLDQDVIKRRENHYGFINYTSALCADSVIFNSTYHKTSFIQSLPDFLDQFPKNDLKNTIKSLEYKSTVIPIGLKAPTQTPEFITSEEMPILLWNHRWEYDKNPESFFNILIRLKKTGHLFKVILCGKKNQNYPKVFDLASTVLNEEIIHYGYAKSNRAYLDLLNKAHLIPVTSIQDFFGISALEAAIHRAYPLFPKRLAFSEHLETEENYYVTDEDLYCKLSELIMDWNTKKHRIAEETKSISEFILNRYHHISMANRLKTHLTVI